MKKTWWKAKAMVRRWLLRVLYVSGGAFLYWRFWGRKKLVILCYHTVGEDPSGIYPSNAVRPGDFKRQMAYLKKHRVVISLRESIRALTNKRALPACSVVITSDDGYKGCLTEMAPILKELGLSATFFVIPGLIEEKRAKWDDVVYQLIQPFPKRVRRWPQAKLWEFLDDTRRQVGAETYDRAEAASAASLASWRDLKELVDMGFSVQSHSLSHAYLATQATETKRREAFDSKRILESQLGTSVDHFAYPIGEPGSYSDGTASILSKAGYKAALVVGRGTNDQKSDLLRLVRNGIERDLPFWQFKMILYGLSP